MHPLKVHAKTILVAGTRLVPIDPAVLAVCPLGEDVDVTTERDVIVIRPVRHKARNGWEEALAKVPDSAIEQDHLELREFREAAHPWDSKDWQW